MLASDLRQYTLANGAPDNDTSPIGGATTATSWVEGTHVLIDQVVVDDESGDDQIYYGAAAKGIQSGATGTLGSPLLVNRCAAIQNLAAGPAVVVSTSELDTGNILAIGKSGGNWVQEEILLTGTYPVSSSVTWDVLSTYIWEYLVGGVTTKPVGNVTISIDGQIVGVIYGTGLPAESDLKNGNSQINTLYTIAAANDKNMVIGWSGTNNRRTAPSMNIGGFSVGNRWTGNDSSIALATDLVASDYYQFAVRAIIPAGLIMPVSNQFHIDVGIIGLAE